MTNERKYGFNPDHPHRFLPHVDSILDRPTVEVMEPEASPALLEADAKEVLMRAVRGDPSITGKQMRAAIALLPFLYPKKGTGSANTNEGFAARLEGMRERSARVVEFRNVEVMKEND